MQRDVSLYQGRSSITKSNYCSISHRVLFKNLQFNTEAFRYIISRLKSRQFQSLGDNRQQNAYALLFEIAQITTCVYSNKEGVGCCLYHLSGRQSLE